MEKMIIFIEDLFVMAVTLDLLSEKDLNVKNAKTLISVKIVMKKMENNTLILSLKFSKKPKKEENSVEEEVL